MSYQRSSAPPAEGSILNADLLCTNCAERLRDALAKFVEVRVQSNLV